MHPDSQESNLFSLKDLRVAIIISSLRLKPKCSSLKDYLYKQASPWRLFEKEFLSMLDDVRSLLLDQEFYKFLEMVHTMGFTAAMKKTDYLKKTHLDLIKEVESLRLQICINRISRGNNDSNYSPIFNDCRIESYPKTSKLIPPSSSNMKSAKSKEECIDVKVMHLETLRNILIAPRSTAKDSRDDMPIISALDSAFNCYIQKALMYLNSLSENGNTPQNSRERKIKGFSEAIELMCKLGTFVMPSFKACFDEDDELLERLIMVLTTILQKSIIMIVSFLCNQFTNTESAIHNYKISERDSQLRDTIVNLVIRINDSFPPISIVVIYILSDLLFHCTEKVRQERLNLEILGATGELFEDSEARLFEISDQILKIQLQSSNTATFSAIMYIEIIKDILSNFSKGDELDVSSDLVSVSRRKLIGKCLVLLESSLSYVPEKVSTGIFHIIYHIKDAFNLNNFNVERCAFSIFTSKITEKPIKIVTLLEDCLSGLRRTPKIKDAQHRQK